MTTVEMEVGERDVQVGDRIIGWTYTPQAGWTNAGGTTTSKVDAEGLLTAAGWRFHAYGRPNVHRFRVRRDLHLNVTQPVVNATFKIPAGRSIPDWPLQCPKCHRYASAVLLFSSFDCKHGCYRRNP